MSNIVVEDIMSKDIFSLYKEDSLEVLSEIMKWRAIRHVPVVTQENQLVGLLTYKDLLEITIECQSVGKDCLQAKGDICIGDVMKTDIIAITAQTSINEAAKQMRSHHYGCLPVVDSDEHKLIGIITESDFVNFFVEYDTFKEVTK